MAPALRRNFLKGMKVNPGSVLGFPPFVALFGEVLGKV